MKAWNSFEEKVIIVADHSERSSQQIIDTLKTSGFSDIHHVCNGEQLYGVLKIHYDQPEKIGAIIINAELPQCQLEDMWQSLSGATDSSVIPFVIHGNTAAGSELVCSNSQKLSKQNTYLAHKIASPINVQELMLVLNFLIRLKQERLIRYKQEEQLITELASKTVNDAKLKFLVNHDELTGLYNRSSFERQLKITLNLSNKLQKEGALLFIDIDRFSLINELEGFEVGDQLLVELTVLVRKLAPTTNLFSRLGSDEFCLFLDNIKPKQAQILAESIKTAVDNFRFFKGDVCYNITISIGIATLDSNSATPHPGEMILHARQACNLAKRCGRDKVRFYDSEELVIKERRHDITWVPLIRKALRENNLFLVFQPVVQLNNGNISHYEVLLRMRDEDEKMIPPSIFIPVAERMGLIHVIDLWVVENAINFLATLPSHKAHISLAINLSCAAFQNTDLLQLIQDKLELTWVDASRLTFEITETSAVDNFEKTREMIQKIRSLGCKFALDDFGAGFCSFNYLRTFPVDYVKIDGQFIRNLVNDETDQILVRSMVDIVAKLGKKTIAEFVESPGIARKLIEIGVDFGQGYAFGKPERELLLGANLSLASLLYPQKNNCMAVNALSECL
ncbi:EAL domain-containing protein [Methylomonas sp. LL1]|uniref:putative bifunctional diguanylate cyclase/phosphodiesterase n=1 Tax=Methylomonas sp. LL1 TaxID=2785785 RepID=UPI0018C3E11A|nr:EAL domain-containing protein [Methylomonas sp. LL1]QPK61610.1 EAL domain-containing protein [Methylomonas sp. LL1]